MRGMTTRLDAGLGASPAPTVRLPRLNLAVAQRRAAVPALWHALAVPLTKTIELAVT
jgi:hypothetical protein